MENWENNLKIIIKYSVTTPLIEALANSVDLDQTALKGAIWSESTSVTTLLQHFRHLIKYIWSNRFGQILTAQSAIFSYAAKVAKYDSENYVLL